jgi:hypothetical protein
MDANWRYCTREICRLRTGRSRDRQIYGRKRHSIEGAGTPDSLTEHEYLFEEIQTDEDGATVPGRYCVGLCEIEVPPERMRPRRLKKKQLKS